MGYNDALEAIRTFRRELPAGRPVYAAIGVFDGVHRGHQAILRKIVADARSDGAVSAVLTFDPHPLAVVGNVKEAPLMLTSLTDRLHLLRQSGIDHVLVIPFTRWLSQLEPETFVEQILSQELGLRRVYVGFSFTFGRHGRGTPDLLRQLGAEHGIEVFECRTISDGPTVLSSTEIRRLLQEGKVKRAARGLGRPHIVEGFVVAGDARGQTIGFPTANISVGGPVLWPGDGVYAVAVCLDDGHVHGAVANLGRRPTVDDSGRRLFEVHLLDYHGNLYGRKLRVAFLDFIRPERKFAHLDELSQQIKQDVMLARQSLSQSLSSVPKDFLCRHAT